MAFAVDLTWMTSQAFLMVHGSNARQIAMGRRNVADRR